MRSDGGDGGGDGGGGDGGGGDGGSGDGGDGVVSMQQRKVDLYFQMFLLED